MLRKVQTLIFLATSVFAFEARAAEICGNGLDDDADLLVDEQCYPGLTTGHCESPLSCVDTGDISPGTGSLRYQLDPDVAPSVPYGPGIGFRRFYVSQYAPGGGAPAYRKPLGERWGHTYMSWLDKNTAPNPDQVVIHLPRGQDAMVFKTNTAGGWDEYQTYQSGFHFTYLRQRATSPNEYELKMLTGEVLVYDSAGKLIEIRDTLATPNKVLVAYDGSGMVSTVTDASGKRRLLFSYTSSLISSIALQINTGSWTTQHTTTYGYTSGNLATVTIGGQLAQTNNYTSNYLTSIVDGNSKTLVSFAYDGATPGKVVRVDTPRGMVGYEFGPSRTECSGSTKTALYFHKANTTSCTSDTDCGTGNLCGGKTGAGATGQCFRAARCLTITSHISGPTDDMITDVSAFAGSSEPCDGACLDALQYVWGPGLDLFAVKDPSSNYTTKAFYSTGMPAIITHGDNNSTSGGGLREVYLYYGNANLPGKVTEIRRKSDLHTSASSCTFTTNVGCAQTLYTYNADGLVSLSEVLGTTTNASGANVSYRNPTAYTYNTKGQLTQIEGPLPGTDDVTLFEYWNAPTEPLKDGFLQNLKRKKDASTFITQSSLAFDFWGNAITLQDADGTVSCQTFDSARGYLTQRREQMAGQSDCTANAADLVTSYLRDSALRLTRLTRPDGSCLMYEYDTRGRLLKTKRRDDCNAASTGDTEEFAYSDDGLPIKTELKNAAGTVTKRQELTYFDSRRLEKSINPVNTAKWQGLAYDARGMVDSITSLDGASTLSKTQWTYDAESRPASERRYTTGSAFDTWNLLFSWLGGQLQVTDGDNKLVYTKRDDLGRVVYVTTSDFSFPTIHVYNEASHLVATKTAYGGSGQKNHSFTHDQLGRPLVTDYHDTCLDDPDVTLIYDTLTGGPSCPGGTSCNNLGGRLAYSKVKLTCLNNALSVTLDQETWYGYDAAGRLTHEYIKDNNSPPRTAAHVFTWTKNGALKEVTLPSTAVLGSTFGSAGSNSDTDRITALWRTNTSTPIINNVIYEPFGPLKQYDQRNSPGSGFLRTRISRNLAYRQTLNIVEKTNGTSTQSSVTLSEDAKGRITTRDYFPSDPTIAGRRDSWYTYDLQDRVICEATTSGSCPTTGATLKNNHSASPPFTAPGDWKQFKRPIPGSTGVTHDVGLIGFRHRISNVGQNDGAPTFGYTSFTYDQRGNRTSDDNSTSLTNDSRTYSYDQRRNIVNVRGEYKSAGTWRFYDVASAFDVKNRRVFKSFYDETSLKSSTWFFYYDALDRLSEVKYTADTSAASTYSVFQLVWLGNKLVAYWQTDYPSVTTSKRYVSTDEMNRPVDMMSWPASGAAARVWTINPDAWGNDTVLVGSSVFQPILFAGQYKDDETVAWQNDGATRHRPGVVLNGYRTYDPWVGAYLQVDPLVDSTWSSYVYANTNPVGNLDPNGMISFGLSFGPAPYGLVFGSCYDYSWTENLSNCLNECGPGERNSTCGCIPYDWTCFSDLGPGIPAINCGQVRGDSISECPGPDCCKAGMKWCDTNTMPTVTCNISAPDCWDQQKCKLALGHEGMACSTSCAAAAYDSITRADDCWKCQMPDLSTEDPFKPRYRMR